MFGRFFVAGLLVGLALAVQVHAQDDQSGFISLDCGSPKDSNYTEKSTGIDYISDADFIDTGIGKKILPELQETMQQHMWYVRSFPDGIRNCYNFNLTKGSKYLIRADFLYGNYDGQDKLPAFDLHIGPNKWQSVTIKDASLELVMEIIYILPSSYLQVCLVNTSSGTPFISSLELRPLKSNIYETHSGSLNTFLRYDIASTTNSFVRFKDDVYDRTWKPVQYDNFALLSTSLTVDPGSGNDYVPPSAVMNTAAVPKSAGASLNFNLSTDDSTLEFYVYFHIAEILELQANESREFNIYLNGQHFVGPFSPKYLQATTVYSKSAWSGGEHSISFYETEKSTHPPIVNAIEVYTVQEFLYSQTDQKDVDAITNIKSTYGVKKNWQGDPCAPQDYLWDGLNCSYDNNSPPRITSLDLSSSGLKGEITAYLFSLTLLEKLDLSNNSLSGSVPDFLSQLPLTALNLSRNNLSGLVPAGLIEKSNNNGPLTLSVEENPNICLLAASCVQKKRNNSMIVPLVASIAAFSTAVIAILTIMCCLKKRKKQAVLVLGKSETELENRNDSFASKQRQFSFSDIMRITQNFEKILGKGGFGTVYHGYLDDTPVAVKMLSSSSVQGYKEFHSEVKLLMRVHHRNLTSLVGYCIEGTNMGIIYEYMANGNLEQYLSGKHEGENAISILSWEDRMRIAVDAAQGLEYLHDGCKPPIIHRDVKSSNILLNDKLQAKIADFGLSKVFQVESGTHISTVVAGTPGYLDPTYFISNRINEKSDIYSFGVVLLEIITSRPVILTALENTHIIKWVNSMLAGGDIRSIVDPKLSDDFKKNSAWKAVELALSCTSQSSSERPTMIEVVMELKECLALAIAPNGEGRHGKKSKGPRRMLTVDVNADEFSPSAR